MADHGHDHAGHDHTAADRGQRVLAYALAINTAFVVVELAGAYLSGSLALLADAVHMVTDSASIGLALFAAWIATRPADAKRTYGYQRAEVLGALANAIFLLAVVGYVLFDAYRRFQDPQPIDATIVVGVGAIGLLANLAAAYVLLGKRDLLNVEGAFLHLLADAAGSVAAIAAGLAIAATGWSVLDPIFALLISALILYSMGDLLREAVNILLQGAPAGVDVAEITRYLADLPGVVDVHDVHVWALSSSEYALTAHVVVTDEMDSDDVVGLCRRRLRDEFGIGHATVQVESEGYVHEVEFDCYADVSET
jgi:cobalt-zinc-cadmium efflux system protein